MANRNNHWSRWGMVILLLVLINLPLLASAEPVLVPCGQSVDGVIKNPCGYQHFLQLMKNVFEYLTTYIAIPLATATIVIGGVIMVTAGTNDGKRSEAKKIIWMAVWGLVIVLASWLIVKLVFDSLVEKTSPYFPSDFK